MAIDPRVVASGIQMGRSLAPQGPPIQEAMAIDMQRNQQIMEVMKELLKTHANDISDLRKLQMSTYTDLVKQASTLPRNDPRAQMLMDKANEVLKWDISHWGVASQLLNGPQGTSPGTDTESVKGRGFSGLDMLTPFMQNAGNFAASAGQNVGSAVMAPINMIGGMLKRKSAPVAPPVTAPAQAAPAPMSFSNPAIATQSTPPKYNPATQKLQKNSRTGEYRVVNK